MTLYFVACTPMHILPCLGMADLAKSLDPSIESRLIVFRYPTLDQVNRSYLKGFDAVHELPYCYYDRDLRRGVASARRFREAAKRVGFEDHSIFFFTESEDLLAHWLLWKLTRKQRHIVHVKFIVATPGSWLNVRVQLLPKRTLLSAAYSLLLGVPLVRFYRSSDTRAISGPINKLPYDALLVLTTANAERAPAHGRVFARMPCPVGFIRRSNLSAAPALPPGSIIYFLGTEDSVAELTEAEYWDFHKRMLDTIARNIPGARRFVKLHPLMPEEALHHHQCDGWQVLPKEFVAEEIIAKNRASIAAVYSTSSTSSLTAACLNIPSYLTYRLLPSPKWLQAYWEKHFQDCPRNLTLVSQWGELETLAPPVPATKTVDDTADRKRWESCLWSLIEMAGARRRGGEPAKAETT